MGKKRKNPKVTVEIVVRPEAAEKQVAALGVLVANLSCSPQPMGPQ